MKLELVPCPTCACFGYDAKCNECLGHGYIPIDRDLELPPTEPLGVPVNMEVYATVPCFNCEMCGRQYDCLECSGIGLIPVPKS